MFVGKSLPLGRFGDSEKSRLFVCLNRRQVDLLAAATDLLSLLEQEDGLMFGRTSPCAIVTPDSSLFSSSSFLMASWR